MAKKNATKRLLIILGILVVLVIIAIIGARAAGLVGGAPAIEVELDDVKTRTVTQVVTASGKVQPEIEVRISPDVSGEIVSLPIVEGQQVKRGQLLARIRPDFYEAQVEQAEASVLQSKASEAQRRADLMSADLDMARQEALYNSGAISIAEYQQAQNRQLVAKAGLEASEYAVAAATARLREATEQLSKTRIYAPMDGTISALPVELGERVVGTTQMTGTEMMRIAMLEQMEIQVDVNENDVVNVSVGDSAAVEVDAYPGRQFQGVVTEIANSARTLGSGTQEQVTNFEVKIRILDAHNLPTDASPGGEVIVDTGEDPAAIESAPSFRPGMSGTVDVYTHTVFDAIAVPIQAVTVRDINALAREAARRPGARPARADSSADKPALEDIPDEEDLRRVVFLYVDGKASMVEVETGISDDSHVVITSGLAGGERVIIGPFRVVSRTLRPDDDVQEMRERPGMAPAADRS